MSKEESKEGGERYEQMLKEEVTYIMNCDNCRERLNLNDWFGEVTKLVFNRRPKTWRFCSEKCHNEYFEKKEGETLK